MNKNSVVLCCVDSFNHQLCEISVNKKPRNLIRMASSWKRTMGNARSFVNNSMGGLRGGSNLAAWVVAGTLAYFLWVKPSQDLKREQQEKAAFASSDPFRYVDTQKPVPDSQVTGLVYGNKNKDNSNRSQD